MARKKYRVIIPVILLLVAAILIAIFSMDQEFMEDEGPKVSLITDENRDRIGVEEYGKYEVISNNSSNCFQEVEDDNNISLSIPPNDIVFATVDSTVFPGVSITEVATDDGITPEFIGENGAVAILTKEDGKGWDCSPGDRITWLFEKYLPQNKSDQAIAIGYIKDGIMYHPKIYQEEIGGEYQVEVNHSGTVYIYILCVSSDPVAVKAGRIDMETERNVQNEENA